MCTNTFGFVMHEEGRRKERYETEVSVMLTERKGRLAHRVSNSPEGLHPDSPRQLSSGTGSSRRPGFVAGQTDSCGRTD